MFEERLRKPLDPGYLTEDIWDIEPCQSDDNGAAVGGPTEAKRWGNNKKKIPKAAKKAKRKAAKRSKQINRK
jgi:hypothetical protein